MRVCGGGGGGGAAGFMQCMCRAAAATACDDRLARPRDAPPHGMACRLASPPASLPCFPSFHIGYIVRSHLKAVVITDGRSVAWYYVHKGTFFIDLMVRWGAGTRGECPHGRLARPSTLAPAARARRPSCLRSSTSSSFSRCRQKMFTAGSTYACCCGEAGSERAASGTRVALPRMAHVRPPFPPPSRLLRIVRVWRVLSVRL